METFWKSPCESRILPCAWNPVSPTPDLPGQQFWRVDSSPLLSQVARQLPWTLDTALNSSFTLRKAREQVCCQGELIFLQSALSLTLTTSQGLCRSMWGDGKGRAVWWDQELSFNEHILKKAGCPLCPGHISPQPATHRSCLTWARNCPVDDMVFSPGHLTTHFTTLLESTPRSLHWTAPEAASFLHASPSVSHGHFACKGSRSQSASPVALENQLGT